MAVFSPRNFSVQMSQQSFALERRRKITFQVLIKSQGLNRKKSEKMERKFSLVEHVDYGCRLLYIA